MKKNGLYVRITEAIDAGIAQALSRRKGEEISVSGNGRKEMSVPGESGTYEKHTKDVHLLKEFISGNFQAFRQTRDYSALNPEEAALICRVFGGNAGHETEEIARNAGIAEEVRPRSREEYEKMAHVFPNLGWTGMMPGLRISFLDQEGNEHPGKDFREGDRLAFVKVTGTHGDEVIIPGDWARYTTSLPWEDDAKVILGDMCVSVECVNGTDYDDAAARAFIYDGFARTRDTLHEAYRGKEMTYWKYAAEDKSLHPKGRTMTMRDFLPAMSWAFCQKRETGGRKFQGYLPSIGEMSVIYTYAPLIDRLLEMAGETPLDLKGRHWQTSTEKSSESNWIWRGRNNSIGNKMDNYAVLTVFREVDRFDPLSDMLAVSPAGPLPLTYHGALNGFRKNPDYQE